MWFSKSVNRKFLNQISFDHTWIILYPIPSEPKTHGKMKVLSPNKNMGYKL